MGDNLLESYNPLYDVHLRQYFGRPAQLKHLQNLGLLDGAPVPQHNNNNSELHSGHLAMMDMMLRNRERVLQQLMDLQRKLDAAEKVELYRRIRSGMTNVDEMDVRNTHMSRSLSRPARSAAPRLEGRGRGTSAGRQRRQSLSPEAGELIKRVETDYRSDSAPFKNPNSIYNRLAANVYKYQYLHKLDDRTLKKYCCSLRKQLQKLERFREVSFGSHTMAKHPPANPQQSWFFRQRRSSLPSLTTSNANQSSRAQTNNARRSPKSGHHKSRAGKSISPARLTRIDEPPAKMLRRTSVSRTRGQPQQQQQRLPPLPKKRSFAASRTTKPPSSAPAGKLPPTAVIRPTRKAPEPQRRPVPVGAKRTPPATAGSRPGSKGSTTPVPVQKPASAASGILPAIGAGAAAATVAAGVAAAAMAGGGKEEEEHRESVAPSPSISLAASQTTTDGGQPGGDSEWEGEAAKAGEEPVAGGTETRPTPEPFLEAETRATEGMETEVVPGMGEDEGAEEEEQMTARASLPKPEEDEQKEEEMAPEAEEHPEEAKMEAEEVTPTEEEAKADEEERKEEEMAPEADEHPEEKEEEPVPIEEAHPEEEEMKMDADVEHPYQTEEQHVEQDQMAASPDQINDETFQRESAPSPEERHEEAEEHHPMEEEGHKEEEEEAEDAKVEAEEHHPGEPENAEEDVHAEESARSKRSIVSAEYGERMPEEGGHKEEADGIPVEPSEDAKAEEEQYPEEPVNVHAEESARSKRSLGSEDYGGTVPPEEDGTSLDAAESEQIRQTVHPNLEQEAGPTDSVRSLASSSGRDEAKEAEDERKDEEGTHFEGQNSLEAEESPEEEVHHQNVEEAQIVDINGNMEERYEEGQPEELPDQKPTEAEEHGEDEYGFERAKREDEADECPPEGCRLPSRPQSEDDGIVQSEEVPREEEDAGRRLSETEELLKEAERDDAHHPDDEEEEHPEGEEKEKEEEAHLVESQSYGSPKPDEGAEEAEDQHPPNEHHPDEESLRESVKQEDEGSLNYSGKPDWSSRGEEEEGEGRSDHPDAAEKELEARRHSHPAESEHPEEEGDERMSSIHSRPATAEVADGSAATDRTSLLLGQPSIEITPASEYGGSIEGSLVSPQVYGQAQAKAGEEEELEEHPEEGAEEDHHHPEEEAEEHHHHLAEEAEEHHPHPEEEAVEYHHPEEETEEHHPHPEEEAEEHHHQHPEEDAVEYHHHPEEETEQHYTPKPEEDHHSIGDENHHSENGHAPEQVLINGDESEQMNGQNGEAHEEMNGGMKKEEEDEEGGGGDERTSLLGNGGNGHVTGKKKHRGSAESLLSDETEGADDDGSDREGSVIIHQEGGGGGGGGGTKDGGHFQSVKLEQDEEEEQQHNNNGTEMIQH